MDKKVTNSVRNVLMNEMGLTRDSIRDEVRKIVRDTAETEIRKIMHTNDMQKLVANTVEQLCRKHYGDRYPIRDAMISEVQSQVGKLLELNLKIGGLEIKSPPTGGEK